MRSNPIEHVMKLARRYKDAPEAKPEKPKAESKPRRRKRKDD